MKGRSGPFGEQNSCVQTSVRPETGPSTLVWRAAAYRLFHTVGGLGRDRTWFLIDTRMLDLLGHQIFTVHAIIRGASSANGL